MFVQLKTGVRHTYNRCEADVEQEEHVRARLTKALFYNELHQSYPVIESHACSHAIVRLTNDRDHLLRHAKKGERSSEKGLINGLVRFGKVDKAYTQESSFLPCQHLSLPNHVHHIGG